MQSKPYYTGPTLLRKQCYKSARKKYITPRGVSKTKETGGVFGNAML